MNKLSILKEKDINCQYLGNCAGLAVESITTLAGKKKKAKLKRVHQV